MKKETERFYPGYLIKDKSDGSLHIVEGDYTMLCAGNGLNFDSIGLYHLDKNMNIIGNDCWHLRSRYEIVDKTHMIENLNKATEYLINVYKDEEDEEY